jgi:hypothetical protein
VKLIEISNDLAHAPKVVPQLIGLLQVGYLVSGECSICSDIILSRVSTGIEPVGQLIKEVFVKHVREKHAASSRW